MTTQISELWVVTKSSCFAVTAWALARMLWLGEQRGEKRGVTGCRVTGNISGWLLNWKQDTFLDTVFIMGKQAWDLLDNLPSPSVWPLFSLSNSTKKLTNQLSSLGGILYVCPLYKYVFYNLAVFGQKGLFCNSRIIVATLITWSRAPRSWRHLLSLSSRPGLLPPNLGLAAHER